VGNLPKAGQFPALAAKGDQQNHPPENHHNVEECKNSVGKEMPSNESYLEQ
jgi:hypothetical protein